jgi:hypothetical protein
METGTDEVVLVSVHSSGVAGSDLVLHVEDGSH